MIDCFVQQNNGRWIDPGDSLLSAILVSMKNAFDGSGTVEPKMGSIGSASLHEPGMRHVLFLVYIPRSMMGFPVEGHVILGSDLTFPQI